MLGLGDSSLPVLVVAGIAVLGIACMLPPGRASLADLTRRNLSAIIFCELLSPAALAIGLLLRFRGINGTQINHTETPWTLRCSTHPREHQFPTPGPLAVALRDQLYYFGYVMVAALTRLSGLSSAIAFNLAGGTIYALQPPASAASSGTWSGSNPMPCRSSQPHATAGNPRRERAGRGRVGDGRPVTRWLPWNG